jgi:UDP-N-acetylmuramate--alanine ligase
VLELEHIRKVYFIGIGGIGMSALARYFKFHGREVSGYDKVETNLTRQLEAEGIKIHYEENPDMAPRDVDIVVYTPAIPGNHAELQFYRQKGYAVLKRSEVLGVITAGSFNICVAGTHGKTTVSTMIAHILRQSGFGCNAFLGGIAVNYNSNYWSNERNLCVVEADEYDRSFLKLSPDMAVITAMDADHLDIYGTLSEMQLAFIEFSGRVKENGILFYKLGLGRTGELKTGKKLSYGLENDKANVYGTNIRTKSGGYQFDVIMDIGSLANVELNMGGLHNVENATVAIAVAKQLGIGDDKILQAVADFRGVKRRFEYILRNEKSVFIDDYAHHPEELKALIHGAKTLFSGKRITIIFQPHLYTRTLDLADGFAEALDLADEVILLPVYPARELPIPGVDSGMILRKMKNPHARLMSKSELPEWIKKNKTEVLITAGAGDIDQLTEPIREILTKK